MFGLGWWRDGGGGGGGGGDDDDDDGGDGGGQTLDPGRHPGQRHTTWLTGTPHTGKRYPRLGKSLTLMFLNSASMLIASGYLLPFLWHFSNTFIHI